MPKGRRRWADAYVALPGATFGVADAGGAVLAVILEVDLAAVGADGLALLADDALSVYTTSGLVPPFVAKYSVTRGSEVTENTEMVDWLS